MGDIYKEFPGIKTEADVEQVNAENIYTHLDEYENEIPTLGLNSLNIYIFEKEEERIDGLQTALHELEQKYILATGIVWPDWVSDEIDDLEVEVLDALKILISVGKTPERDDVETVRENI